VKTSWAASSVFISIRFSSASLVDILNLNSFLDHSLVPVRSSLELPGARLGSSHCILGSHGVPEGTIGGGTAAESMGTSSVYSGGESSEKLLFLILYFPMSTHLISANH